MPKPQTVDSYIKAYPKEAQTHLKQVRALVLKAAPKAQEAIKYGIPTLVYNGNLVHYGAFKNHMTIFPMTVAVRKALGAELAAYKTTVGGVHLPYDKPVPAAMVTKIVKARLKEGAPVYPAKKKKS